MSANARPVEGTVKAKQESESKLERCNQQRKTDVGKQATWRGEIRAGCSSVRLADIHCVLADALHIMLVAVSSRSSAMFRSYVQGSRSSGDNYRKLRDTNVNIKVCLCPGMRRNTWPKANRTLTNPTRTCLGFNTRLRGARAVTELLIHGTAQYCHTYTITYLLTYL